MSTSRFLRIHVIPDSKVHGANMGPTAADRTQVGPMLAPWASLSDMYLLIYFKCDCPNTIEVNLKDACTRTETQQNIIKNEPSACLDVISTKINKPVSKTTWVTNIQYLLQTGLHNTGVLNSNIFEFKIFIEKFKAIAKPLWKLYENAPSRTCIHWGPCHIGIGLYIFTHCLSIMQCGFLSNKEHPLYTAIEYS